MEIDIKKFQSLSSYFYKFIEDKSTDGNQGRSLKTIDNNFILSRQRLGKGHTDRTTLP